jgi:hypothetical protein
VLRGHYITAAAIFFRRQMIVAIRYQRQRASERVMSLL